MAHPIELFRGRFPKEAGLAIACISLSSRGQAGIVERMFGKRRFPQGRFEIRISEMEAKGDFSRTNIWWEKAESSRLFW
jgi:hypothetical protein